MEKLLIRTKPEVQSVFLLMKFQIYENTTRVVCRWPFPPEADRDGMLNHSPTDFF